MSSLQSCVKNGLWKTVEWTNLNIKFEFVDVLPLQKLVDLLSPDFAIVWNEIMETYYHQKNICVIHAYISLNEEDVITRYKDNLIVCECTDLKDSDGILQYFVDKSITNNCIESDYVMIQLLNC